MKVPAALASSFGEPFESLLGRFATERGLMPSVESMHSPRFLARSVVPHVTRLSSFFNRLREDEEGQLPEQGSGLPAYWGKSSNPANLRLAYLLYFMPANLYRVASVWSELSRLGFRWPKEKTLSGIEFGAGPASGVCGIAAGERQAPTALPERGTWALIEQDRSMLELGAEWARSYFDSQSFSEWGIRTFHRKIDLKQGFLPRAAPQFNLWVMSYFMNEFSEPPAEIAQALIRAWDRHLEDEGVVILLEPALRLQSRRLLEIRRELLAEKERQGISWLQVLLPCLGHQACGALADPEDWCHEEVSWMRPPYFRVIDRMAQLDRKSLPFSYLVLARSERAREEILPELAAASERQRLVSPAHAEGKELEFFLCGQGGKQRARYRPTGPEDPGAELERGSVLLGPEIRGDVHSARVEQVKKVL